MTGHDSDGWILNGVLQLEAVVAQNLDLSFTPATNLIPLRRLVASGNREIRLQAAWQDEVQHAG